MPDLNKASPSQNKGKNIESQVWTYLQQQGFQLLHRNFRCRLGEIDLIGLHQNQLLFIEVRFRRNAVYGGAAASVDFRKQRKLLKTAQFFFLRYPKLANYACRFDVVAVTLKNSANAKLEIDWIQNAFC